MLMPLGGIFASEFTGNLNSGLSNSSTINGVAVVSPTASLATGTYSGSQTVTLTAAESHSIRYTLTGTDPTCSSGSVYSSSLTISSTTTLKAVSCYDTDDHVASSVSTYTYTISSSSSGSSSGGGGGSSVSYTLAAPTGGFIFKINNGDASTLSQNVTLTINGGTEAKKMVIVNGSNFTSVGQETYATTKQWTLSSGNGTKQVCAMFYNQAGYHSDPVCATIILGTAPTTSTTTTTNTGTTTTTTTTSTSRIDQLISLTKLGERSDNVKELQQALKDKGFFPAGTAVTGYYGSVTASAVAKYKASLVSSNLTLGPITLDKPLSEMTTEELMSTLLRLIIALKSN